jgi:hypothetical protein
MPIYTHTQTGTLLRWTLAASALIVTIVFTMLPRPIFPTVAVIIVLLLCLLLFHSLTITVTRESVRAVFGIGLIRKTIPLTRIRAATIVRNPWYYGWGIHLTPHGWLFNVSGFDAVELTLDTGRHVRLGTDEPAQLLAAIRCGCGVRLET